MKYGDDIPSTGAASSLLCSSLLAERERLTSEKNHYREKAEALSTEVQWLKEQLGLIQQGRFGKKTEQLPTLQPELFDESDVASCDDSDASLNPDKETITYTRTKTKRQKKYLDTSDLPRERQWHDLAEEEKICTCGHALHPIGEDVREEIQAQTTTLKVIEHVRPKYGCRHCDQIKAAPAIQLPLPKSKASTSLLVEVIMNKYAYHLPLYRQSKMFEAYRLKVGDSTLGYWVMSSAAALEPLGKALFHALQKISAVQVDETPVKVLQPEKKAYLWVYHSYLSPQRFVVFDFCLTRSGCHVNQRLSNFSGILQSDGYGGYNQQRARQDIIKVGCWDHTRRYFTDVIKASGGNKSGKAGGMLKLISKLYKIEEKIKNYSPKARRDYRQKEARTVLEHIKSYANKIHAPPRSLLGKAVHYLKSQWTELVRYVDYGEAELSNCWAENHIRPFAVGRRNWLFLGNAVSGQRAALLYSLIQSCFLNNIDPRAYLTYVLNQAHTMRKGEIDPATLLPHTIDPKKLQKYKV